MIGPQLEDKLPALLSHGDTTEHGALLIATHFKQNLLETCSWRDDVCVLRIRQLQQRSLKGQLEATSNTYAMVLKNAKWN